MTEIGVLPDSWTTDSIDSVTPRNCPYGIVDGPFGSNLKTIHYRSQGIPIITSGYVTQGRFLADYYLYVDKQKFEEEKRSAVAAGDIVMAKIGARCGASAIVPEGHPPGILSGNALKITVDESRHSTFYIWQVLSNMYAEGAMEQLRTVGAQPAISMASLKKQRIALPPLEEQRAIARVLGDVDRAIDVLENLVAKKHDLKQAAMKRLLTGQTRLSGFQNEWHQSSIGREFDVSLGKMLDAARNTGTPKPYVGNRSVQWGRVDVTDLQSVPLSRADQERYRLREGDLLVCEGGEVGRAAVWKAPIDECYYQKALHRLRPLRNMNPYFMAGLFEVWSKQGVLNNYVTQTSIAHLPRERLLTIPLRVPPVPEQNAIADVLASFDRELEALEARRDKTRLLKQAMMQELLTGRTRLV